MYTHKSYQPPHYTMIQNSQISYQPVQLNQIDPQKQHEHCSTAATPKQNKKFSVLNMSKSYQHCKSDLASIKKHIETST